MIEQLPAPFDIPVPSTPSNEQREKESKAALERIKVREKQS